MKKGLFIFISSLLLLSYFSTTKVAAQSNNSIQGEIIYDILVDRFNNGNQKNSDQVDVDDPFTYNGGDIEGITMMLSDIKDLGFTTISLSSVWENAPKGYHGYWIDDFYEIEEQFGTIDDLKVLIEEAHKRDMKVIVELVTNYIADSHPFVTDETKHTWFKENETEPIPATEWMNNTIQLDQSNGEVHDYLLDVATHWMDELDIDGYKLHAVDQMHEDFLEDLTKTIKEKDPEFYVIASSLQGSLNVEELVNNKNIDAIENNEMYEEFNKVLTNADEPISSIYNTWENSIGEKSLLFTDNKNVARFSNDFADQGRNAATTWSLALANLYFLPGVPIVYQGSEVPMYGPGFPENQYFVDFFSADPDIEELFTHFAAMRKEFPALVHGEIEQLAINEGLSLFKRSDGEEDIYVAINNDSESRVVKIDSIGSDLQLRGLIHDDTVREDKEGKFLIGMERESVEVFVVQPNSGFNWWFISFVLGVFAAFVIIVTIAGRKQKQQNKNR